MAELEPLVGTTTCRCGNEKEKNEWQCEVCFNNLCNQYRAMRGSVKGKSFEEQRDAINNFRAGR